MIRIDLDPAAAGTVDADANGSAPDIPGFYETGPVCTIVGPLWANHVQEEIARIVTNHGLEMDVANKSQVSDIIASMTGIYGDGSSGSATLAVNTALAGDAFYEDLTINDGVRLDLAGWRLFVRGTLTIGDGSIISNNGLPGADFSGTPPPFPPGGAGAPGETVGGGGAGGSGGDGAGSATAGAVPSPLPGEGYSGVGGAGGNGSPGVGSESGEAGGLIILPKNARPTFTPAMQTGLVHYQNGTNSFRIMLAGGAGGGGGGAGSAATNLNGYGAGGGGGGGIALVCARVLVGPVAPAGAATIEVLGGDGGTDTTVGIANGGGGGGGGGGTILLTTRVQVGDPGLLVLDVSGGTGGLATTGGNGIGGTNGNAYELFA